MASFLAQLDVWITNVGLPSIGTGVGAKSLSDLSWVLNGYAIVYAALLVPAGRLADRFGRKAGFLLGLTIFGVASLGAAFSSDIWVLVGFRALQAVGAAVMTPASLGLVLTTAPPEKVGKYVKIWFTSGALSATAGPVVGGLLLEASWRWLFLVNIPVVVAAVVLAVKLVAQHPARAGRPLPRPARRSRPHRRRRLAGSRSRRGSVVGLGQRSLHRRCASWPPWASRRSSSARLGTTYPSSSSACSVTASSVLPT